MFNRFLTKPHLSFFLFGPRGTGKTTWIDSTFKDAVCINLLRSKELIEHTANPELLSQIVDAIPENTWIVIDEVQKLPTILDSVHDLIYKSSNKRKFVLTGSSARKLKQHNANMLAGRAVMREFYPLTYFELSEKISLETMLKFGTLPAICNQEDRMDKIDILEAYIGTYIKEEIQQEALVRRLDSFVRFLEVVATMNGQILNIANISNDAKVARTTVNGYFSILEDTLLGFRLPAWRANLKVKEVYHPKFYLFDTGVVRGLNNKLRSAIDDQERGTLLETLVLNELRAYNSYRRLGWQFYYWRTTGGSSEIDIIVNLDNKTNIAIEIKSTQTWKKEYSKVLRNILDEKKVTHAYGIYLGERELKDEKIHIYPANKFFMNLFSDKIIGFR